jgi:hypothetical protein
VRDPAPCQHVQAPDAPPRSCHEDGLLLRGARRTVGDGIHFVSSVLKMGPFWSSQATGTFVDLDDVGTI